MVALDWIRTKGGFSDAADCTWSLRQEYTNRPAMLEIRHEGQVLFTVEYTDQFPKVLIPARYAATFDGTTLKLYRMLSSPELISSNTLSDEAGHFHIQAMKTWMDRQKAA
ncbi:MAG: hypothetical protein K2P81_09995 [Bacteriovoracaceae bacterium]|nr:hypothetical protein [Bacteriovoracaceae bacterium]